MSKYLPIVLFSFIMACSKGADTTPKPRNFALDNSPATAQTSSNVAISTDSNDAPKVAPESPEAALAAKQYREYLNGLGEPNTESIFSARKYFREHYSDKEEEIAEATLRVFMFYYEQLIATAQRIFDSDPKYAKVAEAVSDKTCNGSSEFIKNYKSHDSINVLNENPEAFKELCKFRKSGIIIDTDSEGMAWVLYKDADFIVDVASGVSGGYASFLRLYYPDTKIPWANDGGLVISWEKLGERISRWESFTRRYPNLPETQTVIKPELLEYVGVLIGQPRLDNTHIFARNGGIDPNLKKAYEAFIENNKDSEYFARIKDAYETFSAQEPAKDPAFEAIQLRISNAKDNETIEIQSGQYNVDSGNGLTIKNKKGLKIAGNDGATLVSNSSELEIVRIYNSTEIIINGLTIYHNVPTGCAAACISIEKSASVTIQNSDIHGSGAFGVAAWGWDNTNVRVLNNKIHNCSSSGVEIHSAGGEISHNTFYDNSRDINIGQPPYQSKGIKIFGNTFPNKK